MSEAITVPYKPGAKPISVDIPVFTNADPRLRPQWTVPFVDSRIGGYLVTPEAFPELHRDFKDMLKRAHITGYRLYVSDKIAPHAGRHYASDELHVRRIIISKNTFNSTPYDQLLTFIAGHEMGHAWHTKYPDAKPMPAPAAFSPAKQKEYEADMFGVCLNATTAPLTAWMADGNYHGEPKNYPTNEQLRSALKMLRWSDCPDGAPMPEVPLLLRKPASKTK